MADAIDRTEGLAALLAKHHLLTGDALVYDECACAATFYTVAGWAQHVAVAARGVRPLRASTRR